MENISTIDEKEGIKTCDSTHFTLKESRSSIILGRSILSFIVFSLRFVFASRKGFNTYKQYYTNETIDFFDAFFIVKEEKKMYIKLYH